MEGSRLGQVMRMIAKYVNLVPHDLSGIAERWRKQYETQGRFMEESRKKTYEELKGLGDKPSPEDVARIIGNKTWSYSSCESCSDQVSVLIFIGSDYEPKGYCKTCISEAFELSKDIQ